MQIGESDPNSLLCCSYIVAAAGATMYAVYWFHKALLLIFNSNDVIALLQYSHSSTDFKWLILSLSNTTFHNSIPHFVHLHGISLFWLFVELRCISNYFSFESTILIRFVFGVYLVTQIQVHYNFIFLHIYVANYRNICYSSGLKSN